MTTPPSPQVLFGRKVSLIAYQPPASTPAPFVGPGLNVSSGPAVAQSTPGTGLDLSEFRIQFAVRGADVQTPKNLIARVFNLKDATEKQIKTEFSRVVLQAGYVNGPFAVIFDGTIKEVRTGRLSATDRFLDIYAADGDMGINFAPVNATLAAAQTGAQGQAAALAQAVSSYGVGFNATTLPSTGGILPRGKVLFGMWRDKMRDLANSTSTTWFVENGVVRIVEQTGYLPSDPVVLTAKTGLIEVPEATQDGVKAILLLNPKIKIGTRVQIANALLNQTLVREQGFPNYTSLDFFASTSNDGIYRVLVVEHAGDTRGEEWATMITCLVVDPSAAPASSVPAGSQ